VISSYESNVPANNRALAAGLVDLRSIVEEKQGLRIAALEAAQAARESPRQNVRERRMGQRLAQARDTRFDRVQHGPRIADDRILRPRNLRHSGGNGRRDRAAHVGFAELARIVNCRNQIGEALQIGLVDEVLADRRRHHRGDLVSIGLVDLAFRFDHVGGHAHHQAQWVKAVVLIPLVADFDRVGRPPGTTLLGGAQAELDHVVSSLHITIPPSDSAANQ